MGKSYKSRRPRWKWADKEDNDDGNVQMPPPPFATDACPGSEEKIAMMEWRVTHLFMPHHPGDYREDRRPT